MSKWEFEVANDGTQTMERSGIHVQKLSDCNVVLMQHDLIQVPRVMSSKVNKIVCNNKV